MRPLALRAARAHDPAEVDRIYDVCLRTGASGADATDAFADPRLLGEVYAGPYLRFAPDLAFVLDAGPTTSPTSAQGARPGAGSPGEPVAGVVGYVLGVADTAAFEDELEASWWPDLRARYPLDRFPAGSPDAGVVGLIHEPPRAAPELLRDYPAHLHVDLLPQAQGGGNGRRLIATLLDALRAAGAPGVHLGVAADNVNAQGFYEHLGFRRVEEAQGHVYGLRL
ncbi:GNAT family N-acetyltransferase [Luteimicrobium sp. DT211]|uniref:GNAT family N-acetyltransferase n=1 Tax=Luteimicrobium sp. DT211 TaxID=3393412 RepID=UPI003CF57115